MKFEDFDEFCEDKGFDLHDGKVVDVGNAYAEIREPMRNTFFGVAITMSHGGSVMCPRECRRMAALLLQAADWCEERNESRRSTDVR